MRAVRWFVNYNNAITVPNMEVCGAPAKIRTRNLGLTRDLLYPLSYGRPTLRSRAAM